MQRKIYAKIKQWEQCKSQINSIDNILFDALCDPFEDALFQEEIDNYVKRISEFKNKSQELLKEIQLLFEKEYLNHIPNHLKEIVIANMDMIKMITLNPNILSLPIEELDFIFHLKNINKISNFLMFNSLMKNQECIELLIEKIKDGTIEEYYFDKSDVYTMIKILSINENFDKELLFQMCKSSNSTGVYLEQNIDNKKILEDIYSIYSTNKSLLKKLLGIERDITDENGKLFFLPSDTELEQIKMFLLANTKKLEIVKKYIEIYEECYLYHCEDDVAKIMNRIEVRTAMLSAKTVDHQKKLYEFIKQSGVDIVDEKSPYSCLFPLSKIGSIDLNKFGNYQQLAENINMNSEEEILQKQQLLDIFKNIDSDYFYVYDSKNELKKFPITFYQQFLKNVFFGGYLSQCMYDDGNAIDMPFYDDEIIASYAIQHDLKATAIRTIELGLNKTKDYDIENEIIWNNLFYEARYFQDKQKQKHL